MVAGATGALIGTPAEISLIRMTSDGRYYAHYHCIVGASWSNVGHYYVRRLPPSEQRGYKHVFNALARISKEEGIGTLWRVCYITVTATCNLHFTW